MADTARPTPRWVWGIVLALAALQPLTHLLVLYAPPADTVATGLGIPDSALFLYSMDMFPSGFHSAYATCQTESGDASVRFYNVPHLWLHGLLGLIARVLPFDPFLFYGLTNGIGVAFYLWVVYRFLVFVVPACAHSAFLLFALSGGPGGLLYLATGFAGLHGHPLFEEYFFRFAVYDLMEGPHFNPVLYAPRLYYTLSLGCCLGGLGSVLQGVKRGDAPLHWGWLVAIFLGTFLNARYGVFAFGVLVLYMFAHGTNGGMDWKRALLAYGLPVAAGFLLAGALGRLNPAVVENVLEVGNMALWFSPLVIVTWLHAIVLAPSVTRHLKDSPLRVRLLLFGGLGYLAAYGIGYFLYQGYYGNLLNGRDGSVAAAVSDYALLGALEGVIWAWQGRMATPENRSAKSSAMAQWLLLWLVGYTALALSGFGQGWFLRFGPQRLQVFLWLPLCTLAAMGLATWPAWWRRMAYGVLLGCGITSIAVATLVFQSPVGRAGAQGPYAHLHAENMHAIDARLMDALGEGTVLAPAPASDVVVRRRGNPVVFGIGSFNLTDVPYVELRAVVDTFFSPETPDEARREIATDWCVDWIYCPHTWPMDPSTRDQLRAVPWLEMMADDGDGMVFRVRRD